MTIPAQHFSDASSLTAADLLTPDQLATAFSINLRTLAAWRSTRRGGPAWVKCGSLIRYRRNDVLAWLESRTQNGAKA
jgi:hypothetical protein